MVVAIALIVPAGIALIASTIAVRFWIKDREHTAQIDRLSRAAARRSETRSVPDASPDSPRPPRRDRLRHSVPGGPILIAVPDLSSKGSPPVAAPDATSHRYGPIWDLSDSGASPETIARATGQPVGQVELILRLRRVIAGRG